MDHIRSGTLLEIAKTEKQLTEAEIAHMDKCPECTDAFGKSILEAAQARARAKYKTASKKAGP